MKGKCGNTTVCVIITSFLCILKNCCISQACWMFWKSCPARMIPRSITCQEVTAVWACREQFCCAHGAHSLVTWKVLEEEKSEDQAALGARIVLSNSWHPPQNGSWNFWCRPEAPEATWISFTGQLCLMCHLLKVHMQKQSVFCLIQSVRGRLQRENVCLTEIL